MHELGQLAETVELRTAEAPAAHSPLKLLKTDAKRGFLFFHPILVFSWMYSSLSERVFLLS